MVAVSFPEDAATVIRAVSPTRENHRLHNSAESPMGEEAARSCCCAVRGATHVTVPARGRSSRASGSYLLERCDTRRWSAIFHANPDPLDSPELIRPGLVLRIPPQGDLR